MSDRLHSRGKYAYLLIAFILFWIVLFEFVLSANSFLPSPYFVIISIGDLFSDYHILVNILSTLTAVYFSIIAALFIIWVFRIYLVNGHNLIRHTIDALGWFAGFVPSIILAFFLIYWLDGSGYVKYIFGSFSCLILFFFKLEDAAGKIGSEYIDAAVSLGADHKMISGKIRWKSVIPAVAHYVPEIHLYLWSMIIIIEYIKGGSGLGVVFRQALLYKDLPVLFSTALFTIIVILLAESLIKYLNNKYFARVME